MQQNINPKTKKYNHKKRYKSALMHGSGLLLNYVV